LLLALLRTLWRLSYQEVHDWLSAWPGLALACGLPLGAAGRPRVPSKAQQSKRQRAAGAPASEIRFVLLIRASLWMGPTSAQDLTVDSAPILAWRRADPDAAVGHAPRAPPPPAPIGLSPAYAAVSRDGPAAAVRALPGQHPRRAVRPSTVGTGRPSVRGAPARYPSGRRLLGPQADRLDHTTLGAAAVILWNPKRQKQRDGLPPTGTAAEELGKRTTIERFFGRVLVFFRLQRPPVLGWSAIETRVALTYAAVWVIALAAWQAGRPNLIRSPRLVLAHVWEGMDVWSPLGYTTRTPAVSCDGLGVYKGASYLRES